MDGSQVKKAMDRPNLHKIDEVELVGNPISEGVFSSYLADPGGVTSSEKPTRTRAQTRTSTALMKLSSRSVPDGLTAPGTDSVSKYLADTSGHGDSILKDGVIKRVLKSQELDGETELYTGDSATLPSWAEHR
jgi:hypothetical protein